MEELLDQFTQRSPRSTRLALQVVDYILPANGVAETEQNARVVGVDIKTGQMIEIALRHVEGERPTLSQFFDDRGSSTPVTTNPGGSLVVEGAFLSDQLKPLSGADYPVYSARWLVRAAKDPSHGRAGVFIARVNEPRLSPTNPTRGPYQTVTVLRDETALKITSLKQLDEELLNALDPALHPMQSIDTVPGSLGAVVRLEAPNGNSEIVEMFGGFYLPQGAQHRVPKVRSMVAEDLANNVNWQTRRELIKRGAKSGYSTTLIETRTIMVGPKTMKGKNIIAVKNGAGEPLFSSYVLALRYRDEGSAFLTAAKPESFEYLPSRTGLPSPSERASAHKKAPQAPVQSTQTAQATQAAPAQTAPTVAQSTPEQSVPVSTPVSAAIIRRNPEGGMQVFGHSPEQAQTLSEIAKKVGGSFDPETYVLNIGADALPPTMQRLKNAKIEYEVDQSTPAAPTKSAQSVPNAQPQPQLQPHTPNVQQQHQEPQSAPKELPQQSQNFDLASLDLSNIDIDQALAEAYNNQSPQGPQR